MTFLLTKIFLKSSVQKITEQNGISDVRKKSKAQITLYVLLFAYLIGVMWFLSTKMINVLKEIEAQAVFIDLVFMMVFFLNILQAVFSSINLLYFSKDTDSILTLPLKPYQIILARTNVMLILEIAVNMLIGLVPLVIYGIKLNCNALYYISVVIGLILLPVLPVIIISLISMVIMSFSKITKNKNKFQLFTTLIMLALVVAFSIAITKIDSETMTDEQMAQTLTSAGGFTQMLKTYFPTFGFLSDSVHSNNILTILLETVKTVLVTFAGVIIYLLCAQKLYFKGLIGSLYSGEKTKKGKIKINAKSGKLGFTYVLKELKILVRNPVYLVQCVLPALIFPLLFIGLIFILPEEETSGITNALSMMLEFNKPLILMGLVAAMQFFAMFIYVSITAISREGKNATFIKYIPVPLYKQYIYKIIPNILMNIFSTVIVLGIVRYLLPIPITDLIIVFAVSILMNISLSTLCLIMDLKRPKLQWNTEYAVVKQNMNLVFPMIFGTINIGIIIFVNTTLKMYSAYIQLAIITLIYILLNIFVYIYLYKKQYELAKKII
jgi:ABC-2 type transport system permease protein